MMQLVAEISKKDIARLAKNKGMCNASGFMIDGTGYGPGELIYSGFSGRRIESGKYSGFHGFRMSTTADHGVKTFDFSNLTKVKPKNRSAGDGDSTHGGNHARSEHGREGDQE